MAATNKGVVTPPKYPLMDALRAMRGESRAEVGRLLGISHVHEKFRGARSWTDSDLDALHRHFGAHSAPAKRRAFQLEALLRVGGAAAGGIGREEETES